MSRTLLGSYAKFKMRVYGFPIQFLLVFAFSAVIVLYLTAATATSRIEARGQESMKGSVDSYKWEQAAIWACPLH
jgi:hypothetical protein